MVGNGGWRDYVGTLHNANLVGPINQDIYSKAYIANQYGAGSGPDPNEDTFQSHLGYDVQNVREPILTSGDPGYLPSWNVSRGVYSHITSAWAFNFTSGNPGAWTVTYDDTANPTLNGGEVGPGGPYTTYLDNYWNYMWYATGAGKDADVW